MLCLIYLLQMCVLGKHSGETFSCPVGRTWQMLKTTQGHTGPYNLFFWASMPYWSRTLGISWYLACNTVVWLMLFDVMIYTYHNHTAGERTASSMSSVSHLGYRSRYIRYMVMNSNECKEAKGRSKGSSEITCNETWQDLRNWCTEVKTDGSYTRPPTLDRRNSLFGPASRGLTKKRDLEMV